MKSRKIIVSIVLALLTTPATAIELRKVEPGPSIEKADEAPARKLQKVAPRGPVKATFPSLKVVEPKGGTVGIGRHSRISWTAQNFEGNIDVVIHCFETDRSWTVARGVPAAKGSILWRNGRHLDGYVKASTNIRYVVMLNLLPFTGVSAESDRFHITGDYKINDLSFDPATRNLTVEVGIDHGGMLSPFIENRAYAFLQYRCENSSSPVIWNDIWPSSPANLDSMPPKLTHIFIVPTPWHGDCTITVDPEQFVWERDETNNTKTIMISQERSPVR